MKNCPEARHDTGMTTARVASQKIVQLIAATLRNYHLWAISVMVALLTIVHYHELFAHVWLLDQIGSALGFGLTRQALERILFVVPVTYAAAALGTGAGVSVLVLAVAAMLPRVLIISAAPREALFETGGVILTSALIVALLDSMHKGRERLSELEKTQGMLNLQIKRLGMLHIISGVVNRSRELGEVLATIDRVRQLVPTEAAWCYLCDEEGGKLTLAASCGLSKGVLPKAPVPGEGLDGVVSQSRRPIVVENVSAEPASRSALGQADIRSVAIVPLIAKGETVGTLGVGTRSLHHFLPDEIDLLCATGEQFSMAIENARLYERERRAAEALRVSEKNYRGLFENASDAIWVHDLSGKILAVNSAFERLTGYEREALTGANVSMLLSAHGLSKIDREVHDVTLRGGDAGPYEQELIRKDGSAAIVQIGTSLMTREAKPWAFQHMARDITEEKRIQDNLRFYVQQVSQAQEAERKRIARELHDVTAQALVTVVRNLDDLASGYSRLSVKEIQEHVRGILREVRRFSQQLRPSILDDLGLVPAVKWLASDLTKNSGIAAEVKLVGEPCQLPPDTELMLFRIVQEALTNVQKHSGASEVCIGVEFADRIIKMTVTDNGGGFERPERMGDLARSGKLGLAGMQERAQLVGGTLTINSAPGKGTNLTVEVPL